MTDNAPSMPRAAARWAIVVPLALIALLLVPVASRSARELARQREVDRAVAAHRTRAEQAIAAGDFRRAAVALGAARALAPTDPRVQLQAWHAELKRAAALPQAIRDEDLDELEYALEVVRSEGRLTATKLTAQANVLLRRGDREKARALLEQARAAEPGNLHALLALAGLHRATGRKVEALEAFEAAVKAAPEDLTALNNLGVHYLELGRTEEGLAMLGRAIAVQDNAASRLNLGEALVKLKRLEEALEHFQRAAALAPRSAEVYRRLGGLLLVGGKGADAERMLLKSLELQQDPVTALDLGVLYQVQGRHEQAAGLLRQVLAVRPDAPEVAYRLGFSLKALGDLPGARDAFQRYLRLAAGRPEEAQKVAEVEKALQGLAIAPAAPGRPR